MTPPVQPQVFGQPQGQPTTPPAGGQPQGQPQGPRPITGQDLNARIANGDRNFPQELWGKTLGEAMRYYGVMREDFMRRNDPARQGAQQPPAQPEAPRPTQAPAGYQPPAQAPTQAAPQAFDMNAVRQMVQEAVGAALAPVVVNQAQNVHDQMKREFPDWMQFDQEILESLQGTPQAQLADPSTWRTVYYYIKGQRLSQPNYQAPQAPVHPQAGWSNGGPTYSPPPAPPSNEQPYFSEAPGAPSGHNGGQPSSMVNDPRVRAMAARFNISPEEYVQWMNGNVPPMAGGSHG